MKLNKVPPSSSLIDHGDDNRQEKRKSKKKSHKRSKNTILDDLNNALQKKSLPYFIMEKNGSYYYVDVHSQEVLGEVDGDFLSELTKQIRLVSSKTEKNLTYEKQGPSGELLNLEI